MAHKKTKLVLNNEQVKELEEFIRNAPSKRIGLRASMVLDCGTGMTGKDVAAKYSERPTTVSLWKKRYAESGVSGLLNKPRGRTKDGYGEDFSDRLLEAVHSAPPEGNSMWDINLLSQHLGVPKYGIGRHLKKLGIDLEAQNFFQRHRGDQSDQSDQNDQNDQNDESHEDVIESHEAPAQSETRAAGADETEDHSHMLDVTLTVMVRDRSGRQIMVETSELGSILADPEHFDVSTLSGFRRDYGKFEQGMINGFAALLEKSSDNYTAMASKKKLALNPELPTSVHPVMAEMAKFDMLAVGELAVELKPKEMILTKAQEMLELEAVTEAGASYRRAADLINRFQHRRPGSEVNSRQLDYFATRNGKAIFEMQNEEADAILKEAGIDPTTLKPVNNSVLSSVIKPPEEEDDIKKFEQFREIFEPFNAEHDHYAQIKDAELITKTECSSEKTAIVSIDEIGVKHQREQRRVGDKDPGESAKSTKWVENTLVHVQLGENVYRISAPTMKDAFKLTLAFLLKHALKDGYRLIFFFDGARNIKAGIEKYFGFYPNVAYIDWYHLGKKVKDLSSSAFSGTFEEKRHMIEEIKTRLWAGNVYDAIDYIDSLPVRSESGVNQLKGYLERKRPFIYCYALRKELGYRNASSQVEKTNDLSVAQRQKNNGMSWGYQGSYSLATITTLRLNDELEEWLNTGHIRFGFAEVA